METLWDIGELGRKAGIKVATLRKYVARREIPFVKVGRLVRFRPSEIESWLSQRSRAVRRGPAAAAAQAAPEAAGGREGTGEQSLFGGV
jgi:excisionase family DNA binding protein